MAADLQENEMDLKSMERDNFFIPEFNQNKKLSETDQIKVVYKERPSASEIRAVIVDGTLDAEHGFCKKYVKEIQNFSIKGDPLDTFEKLLECKISGVLILMREIASDLMKVDTFEEGED